MSRLCCPDPTYGQVAPPARGQVRAQVAASAPTEPTGGQRCRGFECHNPAIGWRWYAALGWVPVCADAISPVLPAHLVRYDADLIREAEHAGPKCCACGRCETCSVCGTPEATR